MSLPVFYLMTVLSQYGWVAPNPAEGPLIRVVPVALVMACGWPRCCTQRPRA